jgi:MFS transporter, DHA2 family, metal-tetracycline-proton antiporter
VGHNVTEIFVKTVTRGAETASAGSVLGSERAIVTLVSCCVFISVLNTNMFNVALPEIGREFNITPGGLGWVVTSYSLIFGIGTPFYGRLADIYGLRRMFMIGLTIFSIGSLASMFAPEYYLLIAARVIQAAGTAAIPALGTAAIFRAIPAERRGVATGYISAMVGIGAAIGPSLGGAVTQLVSWRGLFFFGTMLIIAVPLARRVLPADEPEGGATLDLPGGILLGTMIAGLLIAITNLEDFGITSPWVLIPFLVFVTALFLLNYRIRTAPDPFIPPDLLANRNYRMLVFIGFAMLLTHMGTLVTVPLLLDRVNEIGAAEIGIVMLPSAVVLSIAGPFAGRLTDRIGALIPMRTGIALSLAALFLMSTIGAGSSSLVVASILVLTGLGMGLANSPMINSVSLIVPPARTGLAVSIFHMTFFLGGAFGATMITSVIDYRTTSDNALNLLHSGAGVEFSDAFLVPLTICGIALVLSLLLYVPKPWDVGRAERGEKPPEPFEEVRA